MPKGEYRQTDSRYIELPSLEAIQDMESLRAKYQDELEIDSDKQLVTANPNVIIAAAATRVVNLYIFVVLYYIHSV
jgi:hypothetical protein